MSRNWSLASSVLAALAASAASAASAEAPEDAAATEVGQLEEIVVTAERRVQDLQSAPVAVSVRSGEELQQLGRYSVTQILEDVPSVSFESRNTSGATYESPASGIVIRGMTTNFLPAGSYASVVPAAALYVDGVLNGVGSTYDIEQVQVLRGPQGTLYGRSATSGAVLINTTAPALNDFNGKAAVEFGNYSLEHYSAAINVPVGDTVAVRVSGDRYRRDGWYAPTGQRNSSVDGRIKLLFRPSDDFSALVGFALQNHDEFSGERNGYLTGLGTDAVNYYAPTSPAPLGTGEDRTRQYWAQFDWNLGPATLTYIGARRDYEQEAVSYSAPHATVLVTNTLNIPSNPFTTHELRLASNSTSPLQWQTGLFYYENELELQSKAVLTPPSPGVILSQFAPQNRLTRNIGAFAEATYSFTGSTRLTTGLRGDYTKVVMEATACQGPNVDPLPPGSCLILTADEGKETWDNVTYKLRLEHDLTPSNLVYASVATAFLPGDVQVTGSPPVASVYEAETLTSLELGSKNRFLDDRLQLNASAYYYRYGGRQTQVQIGTFAGVPLYTLASSPARMVGGELEVLFQATPHDLIGLNASYTDAYYVDKPQQFALSVTNEHFANVVPGQASATYRRIFDLPWNQELTFSATAQYRSGWLVVDIPAQTEAVGLEPYLRNGSTWQGNLSLAYKFLPNATLSANVRNVTDTVYKTRATAAVRSSPPGAPPLTLAQQVASQGAALSEPRTYSVTVSVSF